ncbi:MAG TPA: 4-hydroxy-tetrahydrodipicolinate synthase [Deltaproteobacteria bacterium]|nr:4-hydroxy-tetrahydrodipicolinate synthase [Deltaproteobacteria bacterium]
MPFEGVLTALVTPFHPDGSLDEATFRALVARQVAAGIGGLVPCGTTGEAPTLDLEEHRQIIRWTVEASGGVPVLAGIGSNNTQTAIETAWAAREAGVQGVLATVPYYNKPTQEGLYRHFRTIAEAVPELEVCLYDVPSRTSVRVSTDTVARLCEIDNITCIKDATADLAAAAELHRITPEGFHVLSGDDPTVLPLIAAGGVGCVSVASNLIPGAMVALVAAARSGEGVQAARQSAALQPLFRALSLQTNPLPIKTALAMKGLCTETFRLPLCPMDPGPREQLGDALRQAGQLG